MPDQFVTSIAIVLVTKGAEALAAGAKDAIASLYRTVRGRLAESADDSAILDRAVAHPEERGHQDELATALARVMTRDPAFEQAVRTRWQAVETELAMPNGAVLNHFSGRAEKVVQARDISGDITF